MLVKRVPALTPEEAAEFLRCSVGTLRNKRKRGYQGPPGPVYSKHPSGRITYRLDVLVAYRDGDERISTTQPYMPQAVAS